MNQRRTDLAGWAWVSPWVIGFLAFMLLPLAMSLYYSFTDYPVLEKPLWTGLDNYRRMLSDQGFLTSVARTGMYALIAIPLSAIVALIIAGLLQQKVRAEGFFQAAVFLPTLVPMGASAMVWLWMLNGQYGLFNRTLSIFGIKGPNWLADSSWIMGSLVLISLWGIGQMVIVFLAAMREVPQQYYEAASIDGMGPVARFRSITLPLISPVILFNVITLTIGAVQIFTIPYILTNAIPGGDPSSMRFFTTSMFNAGFLDGDMGYSSAQAWIQFLIVLGLTGLTFLFSKNKVHYRNA